MYFSKVNFAGFIKKFGFWVITVIYLVILLFAKNIPVFWDMYGQVKTANYFLETNFSDLFPDGNTFSDNGHFPLYALYLALLFKIFGLKLWLAHLSVLPFLFGILWQLQKFCKLFLSELQTFFVLLFTLFHPAFITQSIYFSNEIAIVFFSLWMINSILYERSSHIALASIFLCLLNLRGISLCIILLIYFLIAKRNKNAWYLLCGLIIWTSWLFIHCKITGWFFAGEEIKEFRALATPEMMVRNFLISLWKIIDLGSVFGWAAILAVALKRKTSGEPLVLLMLVSLAVILTCVPTGNPVSNRYFLISYVLLLPAFIYSVGFLDKKLPVVIPVCFAIVLFSNNGVMYPNKYGNAWDCSLKSLAYFDLRKQLDGYVAEQKISPKEVSAGFQLYFNDKFYLMNGTEKEYGLLSDTEMPRSEYVADSDICNNYDELRNQFLKERYSPVKTFKSGAVYINLFRKNPKP
ncbi:MAG TPA: hypothetical protein VNZ49_07380 [Bacteroidia bacterium]|nr:hypothetical protein [Bacteroidia bacterium]